MKCRVCGKDIKIQVRKNTGVCSENCQEVLRIDPDYGRHRPFGDEPKK